MPPLHEARSLAREVRDATGGPGSAIDLEMCCERAGVEIVDAPLGTDGAREALLAPLPGRFRIVINSELSSATADESVRRRRRRFRIAHELGHTFFYARGSSRPRRNLPVGTSAEERFCDDFARWLLAPPLERAVTAGEVPEIQDIYDVSLEVATRTVAASDPTSRVALWWWRPTAESGEQIAVREQWTNDPDWARDLPIHAFRTDPGKLHCLLMQIGNRLGGNFSSCVLPDRGQALAILRCTT